MPNVEKLVNKVDELIEYLKKHEEFRLHQHVDQFYYMQKREELNLLHTETQLLTERLSKYNEWLHVRYQEVFGRWREDRLWINRRSET